MESSGPPQGPDPSGPQGPQAPPGYQRPPAAQPPAAPTQPGGPPAPPGYQQPPAAATTEADPYHGQKFPMGRAWIFTILSFGLWGFYWFYSTRKQIDQELGGYRDDALLHTLGLLVPILNFFIIYWLWRDISLVCERAGVGGFSDGGYLAGLILLSFVGLGAPIMYTLVLSKLNEYWDRRAGGVATERPVQTIEKVLVAIGIALFLLYVIFIIIIIAAAGTSTTYG